MDGRRRLCVVAAALLLSVAPVRSLDYSITTTWNGGALDHTPVKLSLSSSPDHQLLYLDIDAPFFNDPASPPGPPGQPFYGLWDYEVVEAFFLNDADQYLEVEVCPWGQHIVLLLSGQRVTVRHSLQMEVTTERGAGVWTGRASIPVTFLPQNVTKFNAYAIHGSGSNRIYESLYPAPSTASAPDFHALEYFEPIDLSGLLPDQASDPKSELWTDALQGLFRYRITTTWDDRPLASKPVQITLQGFEAGVEMNVTAPFYKDPPPSGPPGEPFYGLWDYEVVEMFFLNDNDEYLEVELGPWGQHLLLLLEGERNAIKHSLPLDYLVTERIDPEKGVPGQWKGSAMIPPEYFPPNVTRMNAYAIHGVDQAREYQSLYPAPQDDPNYPQADFHRLDLFRAIDFEFQVKENKNYSDVWLDAMGSAGSPTPTVLPTDAEPEVVTVLGPTPSRSTVTPEPTTTPDSLTTVPEAINTIVPESINTIIPEPTIVPEPSNVIVPEPSNAIDPEPTIAPQPSNTIFPESANTVSFDSTTDPEPTSLDLTTLSLIAPAPTTFPEPETEPATTQHPKGSGATVRRRPHPHRVDPSLPRGHLQAHTLSQSTNPGSGPKPNPQLLRPNRRVGIQRQPPQPQQSVTSHPNRPQEHSFPQRGRQPVSQQDQRFDFDQQPQPQQGLPRPSLHQDNRFQIRQDQQFQPPRDQGFQTDHFQPPRVNPQQTRPRRPVQQRDEQLNNEPTQQFQSQQSPTFQNRNQQFRPPHNQQFQQNQNQHFQSPQDQPIQPPRNQQFQPQQNRPRPPHTQNQQSQPRDEELPPAQTQHREEDATTSRGEAGVGEAPQVQQEVEAAVLALTEGSPALPPPHPICFAPGLVIDEHRCWVFHECELEAGEWRVYSWKCVRGHVYDPHTVACVPGRCRRRG